MDWLIDNGESIYEEINTENYAMLDFCDIKFIVKIVFSFLLFLIHWFCLINKKWKQNFRFDPISLIT